MRVLIIATSLILVSCSGSGSINKGEFSSLNSCLNAIKTKTGATVTFTSKDTPTEVVGTLSNGETFWCKRKETGTKGTYYEGAFTGD